MAGFYPDVPGLRVPYDMDGTVGFFTVGSLSATNAQLRSLNNEATREDFGTSWRYGYFGFVFPTKMDIVGYSFNSNNQSGFTSNPIQTSADTTNGIDGTWTTQANGVQWSGTTYRNNITSVTWNGIKGVRFYWGEYTNEMIWLHLYGTPTAGETEYLALWHPTLDQRLGGADLDWGDVGRNTTADKTCRVRNRHATLTANTVTISSEALTDASPALAGQFSLSLDGTTFAATRTISSIGPATTSGTVTVRRTTSPTAQLGVWVVRHPVTAASWS